MEEVSLLYDQVLNRVPLYRLGLAFGFVLGGLVARRVALYILDRYAGRLARLSRTDLDDLFLEALQRPLGWAMLLLGIYMAVQSLSPSATVRAWANSAFSVLVGALLAWLMLRAVNVLTLLLHRWAEKTDSALDDQLVPLVGRAAKVVVGILAGLMILQNMGYSVSGLIAGLGVGGLAVALAAQKTLSDLFGSIMLLVDRPFTLGDWVKSPDGNIEGVVERIGFRSTRIRTFEKTLVSVPNSRLAEFIIDNMAQRPVRRVWITVGLTYDTTAGQMREAVGAIQSLLRTHPEVDPAFFLVYFTDFGPHALDIMVYYFTNTTVWDDYLRIREDVNLKIMETLESMGLSIAFPTQTVHLVEDEETGGRNVE